MIRAYPRGPRATAERVRPGGAVPGPRSPQSSRRRHPAAGYTVRRIARCGMPASENSGPYAV
ncbi:hypothetical protein GCM10009549_21600 [Streptomyces thermoalcalitolerans]|uniref:Uncharacterized protein n=1 Tax=Streptomyces thermoalcalitolerans TaxID=65605 RepID=A0ABP3Z1G0_9ACTN